MVVSLEHVPCSRRSLRHDGDSQLEEHHNKAPQQRHSTGILHSPRLEKGKKSPAPSQVLPCLERDQCQANGESQIVWRERKVNEVILLFPQNQNTSILHIFPLHSTCSTYDGGSPDPLAPSRIQTARHDKRRNRQIHRFPLLPFLALHPILPTQTQTSYITPTTPSQAYTSRAKASSTGATSIEDGR